MIVNGRRLRSRLGLPCWHREHSGKESACWCKRLEFHVWVGKIPWRKKWQFTPVFLPAKSHRQRSSVGYSPWGNKESDTTEHSTRIKVRRSTLTILINILLEVFFFLSYCHCNRQKNIVCKRKQSVMSGEMIVYTENNKKSTKYNPTNS